MAFSRPPLPVSASPTAPTAHSSADASYRAAEKAATPSCFACRFSSDWHTASRLYHEAGAGFALERNWSRAQEAYERAAFAQESSGSAYHAAKEYVEAAKCARFAGSPEGVRHLSQEAMRLYFAVDRDHKVAEVLGLAATALRELDAREDAEDFYVDAVLLLRKSSSNLALSQKVYQDAAHGLLALDSHQKAADVYMRYGATLVETGQVHLAHKMYLAAVVTALYLPNIRWAWTLYQIALDTSRDSGFDQSDVARATDGLFVAVSTGREDEVRRYVREGTYATIFQHLDVPAARLAMMLPRGDMRTQGEYVAGILGVNDPDHDPLQGGEYERALDVGDVTVQSTLPDDLR